MNLTITPDEMTRDEGDLVDALFAIVWKDDIKDYKRKERIRQAKKIEKLSAEDVINYRHARMGIVSERKKTNQCYSFSMSE